MIEKISQINTLKLKFLSSLSILTLLITILPPLPAQAVNKEEFCISSKCKEAAKAAAEAAKKSEAAAQNATSLDQVVTALGQEINTLEAHIVASRARSADLRVRINETKVQLEKKQSALADALVTLHFERQPNTLAVLAGSKSLGDFAKRQARLHTIKEEVASKISAIQVDKQALERQKQAVERTLLDQERQQQVADQKKAYQAQLANQYRHNAAAFEAEAKAALKVKEAEIAKEIALRNSKGLVGMGVNNYDYRNICPGANLTWGNQWGYVCQCVSYTGNMVYKYWGINVAYWGNANTWDDYARARGYRVDKTPAVATVAVQEGGPYGHVMWIEKVNADGTVNLSEYNNIYSSRSGRPGDYGYRTNVPTYDLVFIHFDSKR